ncbi:hypothetical protein ABT052_25595 [Streptomyces sp. NPDC002766]|uniref:hypothetical protein n=1 Tax=Streptomyces sp. NPDC002766 TaxID=3154429 RepID=UPI00331CD986
MARAAGFAGTAVDEIRIDFVARDSVRIHLHAVHTDGGTAEYAGSCTVRDGTAPRTPAG